MADKADGQRSDQLTQNTQKWTRPLMEAGWTALPSIILEKQEALGLDPIDMNILFHLARFWWFKDQLPYPAKGTIAKCMQVHPTTIRRHIARMEELGFIKRVKRRDPVSGRQETNVYDVAGLIKETTPYAMEAIEERKRQRQETALRRKRKRPVAGRQSVGGGSPDRRR